MHIYVGENNGFCFGVSRAIKTTLELNSNNNYVLGEIIHNEKVNQQLTDKGIKTIDNIDCVNFKGDETVIIRTHGEQKLTFEKLKKMNVKIIDCTCPFVKQIHDIVS